MGDPTEPLGSRREPTDPLPARAATPPRRGIGDGDRRLWIVAALLAIVLAFVAGYLVGRGGGAEPTTKAGGPAGADGGGGPVRKQACAKAVAAGEKALAIQARALANRAALLEATADGDGELVARLNEEFRTMGERFEKVEARLDRLATRCGA